MSSWLVASAIFCAIRMYCAPIVFTWLSVNIILPINHIMFASNDRVIWRHRPSLDNWTSISIFNKDKLVSTTTKIWTLTSMYEPWTIQIHNEMYLKLLQPKIRWPMFIKIQGQNTSMNTLETCCHVLLQTNRCLQRPNSLPRQRKVQQVRHVLQSRSHLSTPEVKHVGLRPPTVH
jgi:hypothetical protein